MSKLSRTGTIERLESAGIIAIFRTDDAGQFVGADFSPENTFLLAGHDGFA